MPRLLEIANRPMKTFLVIMFLKDRAAMVFTYARSRKEARAIMKKGGRMQVFELVPLGSK